MCHRAKFPITDSRPASERVLPLKTGESLESCENKSIENYITELLRLRTIANKLGLVVLVAFLDVLIQKWGGKING